MTLRPFFLMLSIPVAVRAWKLISHRLENGVHTGRLGNETRSLLKRGRISQPDLMVTQTAQVTKSTQPLLRPVSFYRRRLPDVCTAFSSAEGRTIFREAMAEGNMEGYFQLAEQFRTQDDPAFCGLSTLTMVLNALAVDPGRTWKGPWRWYHETMLDCCAPLEVVRDKGIAFKTLMCLARCNGLRVVEGGPAVGTEEDFRRSVREACNRDGGSVVVASYNRKGLSQTGGGHFSPVGGFHEGRDLVLVMDVARFKLPPHWVPLPLLWEAMKSIDKETGRCRGYMVLSRAAERGEMSAGLFTLSPGAYHDWPQARKGGEGGGGKGWVCIFLSLALGTGKPSSVTSSYSGDDLWRGVGVGDESLITPPDVKDLAKADSLGEFVRRLMQVLPSEMEQLLTTFREGYPSAEGHGRGEGVVIQAIQGTEVYTEVAKAYHFSEGDSTCGEGPGAAVAEGAGDGDGAWASALAAGSGPRSAVLSESRGCGCSTKHAMSVLVLSCLLLLHEEYGPARASVVRAAGEEGQSLGGAGFRAGLGDGGVGGDTRGGRGTGDLSWVLWWKDPVAHVPEAVAHEVKHVANILRGLVDMKEVER
ncbi:unnamed protein product, partial [Discosporangium mesarthrocarpum]